ADGNLAHQPCAAFDANPVHNPSHGQSADSRPFYRLIPASDRTRMQTSPASRPLSGALAALARRRLAWTRRAWFRPLSGVSNWPSAPLPNARSGVRIWPSLRSFPGPFRWAIGSGPAGFQPGNAWIAGVA